MRVLGIIPARGGSKGVPRKNIRSLCGKPLLAYTAESARAAKRLTRVIVSTEDAEIVEVAKKLGVDVPFIRPAELAEDTTPTLPVVLYTIKKLEEMGEQYDAVCLLQPTNPLRKAEDIDACIELLELSGADSVMSVLSVPETYNPNWTYWKDPDGRMRLVNGETEPISRRQDLPAAFHRDGSVYVTRRDVLIEQNSLYGRITFGYHIEPGNSVNIDSMDDWREVENRMQPLLPYTPS